MMEKKILNVNFEMKISSKRGYATMLFSIRKGKFLPYESKHVWKSSFEHTYSIFPGTYLLIEVSQVPGRVPRYRVEAWIKKYPEDYNTQTEAHVMIGVKEASSLDNPILRDALVRLPLTQADYHAPRKEYKEEEVRNLLQFIRDNNGRELYPDIEHGSGTGDLVTINMYNIFGASNTARNEAIFDHRMKKYLEYAISQHMISYAHKYHIHAGQYVQLIHNYGRSNELQLRLTTFNKDRLIVYSYDIKPDMEVTIKFDTIKEFREKIYKYIAHPDILIDFVRAIPRYHMDAYINKKTVYEDVAVQELIAFINKYNNETITLE